MPTYEYKCPAGHVFEKFYPTMNYKRREKWPTCGKPAERQISGRAGLVFHGSGFYTTDYKRAGEKQGPQEQKQQKDESQPAAAAKPPQSKSGERAKKQKDSRD